MKRLNLAAIAIIAALLALAWGLPAYAAQTMKFKAVAYIPQVHKMQIPDADQHIMGVYEHKGVALFPGGQTAAFLDIGHFDMYEPNGDHWGYARLTFGDGSVVWFEYQGKEYRKKGATLPSVKGTGSFIKGTGRYKGIKGSLTYSGGYVTPYDEKTGSVADSVIDYQATYTLGK